MIYRFPSHEEAIDQGDIIEGCPILSLLRFDVDKPSEIETKHSLQRIVVLTQTCDLANRKATRIIAALIFDAQKVILDQLLKASDVHGPLRNGRIFGWYFLPKSIEAGLPEMIVDFRQVHTLRMDMLTSLCQRGQRKARVQPLYREHLAKHFADTYSRIGLPQPYETEA